MFAENIYNFRKNKGYSQEQLAEILGVSRQTIYNWESGSSYPDVDKLIEISQLIGCTLDDLMREKIDYRAQKAEIVNEEARDIVNLEFHRFALGISLGTLLIILGVSLFIFLLLHEPIKNMPIAFVGLGIPGVLGILLLVYSGLRHTTFRNTYSYATLFLKEDRQRFFTRYSLFVTLSLGLILLGVLFIIIFYQISAFTIWPISVALLIIGSGVSLLIYHSVILSKYTEFGEKKEQDRQSQLHDKITTIIMLTATAIYITCGFIWQLWHIAWLVFVFGGILSQIIYTIMKKE